MLRESLSLCTRLVCALLFVSGEETTTWIIFKVKDHDFKDSLALTFSVWTSVSLTHTQLT